MDESLKKVPLYKKIIPWLVSGAILVFLFYRIDREQFIVSLFKADLHIYLPLVMFFILIWYFIEAQNIQKLYQYFGIDVSYPEMLKIRGATFLLMIINYGLGAGGIALYMKKIRNVPIFKSVGMFFYYMVIESGAITFLAMMGCLFTSESSVMLDRIFMLCLGLFLFYNAEIVILRNMPAWGFLRRLREKSFFHVFRTCTLRSYAGLFFYRSCYFLTFVVFFYFALRAFHIEIPMLTLTALVPIIFFVGNLPITPFGLGTIQAAMLYFFKSYSSEANILAVSIVYSTSLIFFRAVIGLFSLSRVTSIDLYEKDDDETGGDEVAGIINDEQMLDDRSVQIVQGDCVQ